MTRNIISCSRRTDIPAFYTPWLLSRLRAGFCHVKNPFGPQIQRVSLLPENVAGFVFWTRFPKPLLPHLPALRTAGYEYYFFVTINGYPRAIEQSNPPLEAQVSVFRQLAALNPGRIFWRYDPILISRQTPPDYHSGRFSEIAAALAGYTSRCYISFTVWYRKTRSNLVSIDRAGEFRFEDPGVAQRRLLAGHLQDIGAGHGIQLYSCSEDALLQPGILKAHCSDATLFQNAGSAKRQPLRRECGCIHSVDIGAYDTCLFGCRYCYATRNHGAALPARAAHDPNDTILYRPPHLLHRALDDREAGMETAVCGRAVVARL